jgi:hypothetical protein
MSIHVKDSGTIKEALEVYVNDEGTWKTALEVHVNQNGIWKKAFPTPGSQTYSTAGTYSFTVPGGIYSLSLDKMSGGGGGGPSGYHSGDCHSGVPGLAGSAYTTAQSFAVTPGETLTVIIGAGGIGGCCWAFQAPQRIGTSGGYSYVKRGSTILYDRAGGAARGGIYYSGSDFRTPGLTNGTGFGTGGSGGSCTGNGGNATDGGVVFSWS